MHRYCQTKEKRLWEQPAVASYDICSISRTFKQHGLTGTLLFRVIRTQICNIQDIFPLHIRQSAIADAMKASCSMLIFFINCQEGATLVHHQILYQRKDECSM